MHIKICGLFRDKDIDYVNEARPNYAGFVFTKSPRQISAVMAQYLRFRLADGIEPVGVFVNAPIKLIAELYKKEIISIAQLHGAEDDAYIKRLKEVTAKDNIKIIPVIKAIKLDNKDKGRTIATNADFLLLDSGAGSGKTFNWDMLKSIKINKPWFLAGGINLKNIDKAMALKPYGIDVSSGAETDGIKDRKKILELTSIMGKPAKKPDNIQINYTMQVEHYRRRATLNIKE
ncbi:MAG: phosphoribosylanthranilate isomerase [Treponema sp.]|jgi:phosphoribosylanthranilate isomerase|nr:phosphoribosylanthranilate isomerase [Treponema sp.]